MAYWGELGLQEGMSDIMFMMISFHDYLMVITCGILGVVFYSFYVIVVSKGVDKYVVDSHFLEFVWTVLPMLVLVFMALPSLQLLYSSEDYSTSGLSVKVVGHQWYWEYEQGGLEGFDSYMMSSSSTPGIYRNLDVDNRVSIPVSVNTIFMVTSADVLHSWTVPSLGVKADAIPGRINYLSVCPSVTGVYYGQCSELCGSNHSFMPIVVEVLSCSDYLNS